MELLTIFVLIIVLIILGIREFQNHQQVLSKIPIRIHINGTRGKSSVTRLVAAGLRYGGLKTYFVVPFIIQSKTKRARMICLIPIFFRGFLLFNVKFQFLDNIRIVFYQH